MSDHLYDLEERLLEYAALIVRLVEELPSTRAGNHAAGQRLRSGTSVLPNHGEAEGAESRNDFIHKLGVCHKELRESRRWLRLIQRVPLLTAAAELEKALKETAELVRILAASLHTARANAREGAMCREEPGAYSCVERSTLNVQLSTLNAQHFGVRTEVE